jgi:hypothetical protein
MFGITFNGKHSYNDFGLRVIDKTIGNPSKIKVKERIPFSNQIYDFSQIYGGQEYEERQLTYVFDLKDYDKKMLAIRKTEILNWLMGPIGKTKLVDDYIEGYYFLAEVEEAPDFDEMRFRGTLTVNFTAYPFQIAELHEGNDIWDTFNFLLDVAQITDFTVNGSLFAKIINPGVSVLVPTIISNAQMSIIKEGSTFLVPPGTSKSPDFCLYPGENPMTIQGKGTISFKSYKELI